MFRCPLYTSNHSRREISRLCSQEGCDKFTSVGPLYFGLFLFSPSLFQLLSFSFHTLRLNDLFPHLSHVVPVFFHVGSYSVYGRLRPTIYKGHPRLRPTVVVLFLGIPRHVLIVKLLHRRTVTEFSSVPQDGGFRVGLKGIIRMTKGYLLIVTKGSPSLLRKRDPTVYRGPSTTVKGH